MIKVTSDVPGIASAAPQTRSHVVPDFSEKLFANQNRASSSASSPVSAGSHKPASGPAQPRSASKAPRSGATNEASPSVPKPSGEADARPELPASARESEQGGRRISTLISGAVYPTGDVAIHAGMIAPSVGLAEGEVAWERIYAEHLVANGYLSVVDRVTSKEESPERQTTIGGWNELLVASAQSLSAPEARAGLADTQTAIDEGNPVEGPILQAAEAVGMHIATGSGSEIPLQGPSTAMDASWAQRLIRVTQGPDGVKTAWLRDFGLDAESFGSVAEWLRRNALSAGIRVDRVVINGREIWRAAIPERGC